MFKKKMLACIYQLAPFILYCYSKNENNYYLCGQ